MNRQAYGQQMPVLILIVEDDPLVRMVAADTLQDAGYRVIEATDADEALVLLDARPDVRAMVTDVRMPGELDGIGLSIIVAERFPAVGIVVVSGHALPQKGDLPAQATFVPKPYYPSQLIAAVETHLGETSERPISVETAIIVPVDAVGEALSSPAAGSEGVDRATEATDED